ncbi:MAG: hypothetical protein R8G66_01835 [Cytophagales bacterium]|nr:hypothetical protein [Cytophagales bacterium]
MNKRLLLFQIAFLISVACWSQSLESFNTNRLDLNKKGMIVLGTWDWPIWLPVRSLPPGQQAQGSTFIK